MIKEIIVVEGKADTAAIKRAVDADTIETGGSAISEETIEKIRLAKKKRGVIVFTDPDVQGERIRRIISEKVPGCKHAFISREEGKGKRNLGVENALPEMIRRALTEAKIEYENLEETISFNDLTEAGLVFGADARAKREKLGEKLGVGYANAKQFYKRLNQFRISKKEFDAAVAWLKGQGF